MEEHLLGIRKKVENHRKFLLLEPTRSEIASVNPFPLYYTLRSSLVCLNQFYERYPDEILKFNSKSEVKEKHEELKNIETVEEIIYVYLQSFPQLTSEFMYALLLLQITFTFLHSYLSSIISYAWKIVLTVKKRKTDLLFRVSGIESFDLNFWCRRFGRFMNTGTRPIFVIGGLGEVFRTTSYR